MMVDKQERERILNLIKADEIELKKKSAGKMNELQKLKIDLSNKSVSEVLMNPANWGVINFRISSHFYKGCRPLYYLYLPIWRIGTMITGIEICGDTIIGEGLDVRHFGQVFINPKSVIGKNCIIYNSVSIGSAEYVGGECPVLGDGVKIGVGAKVLGEIIIGDNCKIGANAVVTKSFSKNSILVGIPAKRINRDGEQ